MSDTFVVYLVLCLSAFAAGAINAIAGGGTLLTFPALQQVFVRRLFENASILANATSTVSLLPGSIASAFGYRHELWACRRLIVWLLAPSILGGVLGSLLLTEFPASMFDSVVPWCILAAAIMFLIQEPLKRLTGAGKPHSKPSPGTMCAVVVAQFLIALYGGYFGAGIGILMLSVLPFMGTSTIHEANAAKTILAAAINVVTVTNFLVNGLIVWNYALAMAITAIAGGYFGAKYARKLPSAVVRSIVVVIGFGLGAFYLWGQLTRAG